MKPNILFVDDEQLVLRGYKRSLYSLRNQWNMIFSTSAFEAIEIIKEYYNHQNDIHIVVTDMQMPEITGVEFCKILTNNYPSIIRIILSGQVSRHSSHMAVTCAHQLLSKPCETKLLVDTLTKALNVGQLINNQAIKFKLNKMVALPVVPDIYLQLVSALKSKEVSMEGVADIISKDFSLSIKVLQLVNSAFFGMTNKVSSIKQAVTLLGGNNISSLVLQVGLFATITQENYQRFKLDEVWEHSLYSASVVRQFSKLEKIEQNIAEESVLAALLHDVGKVAFAICLADEYYLMMQEYELDNLNDDSVILRAEKQTFGFTHAELGAYLLGVWGFPVSIIESILFIHHLNFEQLSKTHLDCNNLLFLGDFLSQKNDDKDSKYQQRMHDLKTFNHPLITPEKLDYWEAELDLIIAGYEHD